jgi:hypothetical protein
LPLNDLQKRLDGRASRPCLLEPSRSFLKVFVAIAAATGENSHCFTPI